MLSPLYVTVIDCVVDGELNVVCMVSAWDVFVTVRVGEVHHLCSMMLYWSVTTVLRMNDTVDASVVTDGVGGGETVDGGGDDVVIEVV